MTVDEYKNHVLDEINNCISPCTDIGTSCLKREQIVDLDWLMENLPGMNYVLNRALNYIFSNGLTAGGDDDDRLLDVWLYERQNRLGASNYLVLRTVIGNAIAFGECGLRLLGNALYPYRKGTFGVLYRKMEGITAIEGYFIREDGGTVEDEIDAKEWESFSTYQDLDEWFRERKMILLDPSEFVNVRSDTSHIHGISPLMQDRQRIKLLLSVYSRMNYDIEYDGPGRIILRAKSNYGVRDNEQSTATTILNNSGAAQQKHIEAAKAEARRVANELKSSSSDNVIVISDGFKDEIEHLPRVTKSTEFMDWISNEGVIIAQILGMSSVLVEVGKWSGNVSMEKIIDDAMINTIIPLRELYAVQFSGMISRALGVGKVYFDKYDMKQAEDENAARTKIANVIRDLSVSVKNIKDNGDDKTAANVGTLIDEVAEVLRKGLYDVNGNIRAK